MKNISLFLLLAYDCIVFYVGLLLFGLICLLWSWLAVPLRMVMPWKAGRRLGRLAISCIFRVFFGLLQLTGRFRFDLDELDALRDETSVILAPNHPSLWDAIIIASRLPDAACVMKTPIVNNPFLGGGARLARYIPGTPLRPMISLAVAEIESGGQLLLFPEGTRTTRHPVNPLGGSISIIAARAQAPVQTILIETDSPFLSKGWPVYRKPTMPIACRMRLGRRFAARGDNAALMTELEQYFSAELAKQGAFGDKPVFLPDAVRAE